MKNAYQDFLNIYDNGKNGIEIEYKVYSQNNNNDDDNAPVLSLDTPKNNCDENER